MKAGDKRESATSGARSIAAWGSRNEFASGFLDRLIEGCQIIGPDWTYLYVNDVAATYVQRRKEEILGQSVLGCFPGVERTPLFARLERCMKGGLADQMQHQCAYADGTSRWFELRFFPLPEGLCVLSLDITEAKRQAEAAQQQRSQLTSEDVTLLADAGAVLTQTLDYEDVCGNVAKLAARCLADVCVLEAFDEADTPHRIRVAHRDPKQQPLADRLLLAPIDLRKPHLGYTALIAGQQRVTNGISDEYCRAVSQDAAHERLLQELAPSAVFEVPLEAHGRRLGAMVLVKTGDNQRFDAKDVALGEEMARRAALAVANARLYRQAVAAIRSRDDVLTVVAHDLRNPLNAMLLQLQMLRRTGQEPERRTQWPLAAVLREGARLNQMIEDLLDVTRIEAGTFAIRPTLIQAEEIASEVMETYQPLAADSNVELRVEVESSIPAQMADRFRIHQVLGNLIGNALKFTRRGGHVALHVRRDDHDTVFSVTDTGEGIAPEQRPHLFDRFWQAQRIDRRGAGLGLWIAKAIVEAHGGRIWLDATSSAGSTFAFRLPLG